MFSILYYLVLKVTNSVSSGVNVKEALETLDALTNNQAVVLYKQCQVFPRTLQGGQEHGTYVLSMVILLVALYLWVIQ